MMIVNSNGGEGKGGGGKRSSLPRHSHRRRPLMTAWRRKKKEGGRLRGAAALPTAHRQKRRPPLWRPKTARGGEKRRLNWRKAQAAGVKVSAFIIRRLQARSRWGSGSRLSALSPHAHALAHHQAASAPGDGSLPAMSRWRGAPRFALDHPQPAHRPKLRPLIHERCAPAGG
jgi:hypothetical protein